MAARILSIALLAFLAGCMPQGDFPSLAKRPIESTYNQPPAVRAAEPAASDPAALARVQSALESARNSVAPFAAAIAEARPLVAASQDAPEGSERWIEGQIAASRIDPLLDPATTALADLEQELRKAMTTPGSADREAVEIAIAETSAIVTRQAEAARALNELLPKEYFPP